MCTHAQASVQSLREEVDALKSLLAEKEEQIERWSKEAATAQSALQQRSGSARELASQACASLKTPSHTEDQSTSGVSVLIVMSFYALWPQFLFIFVVRLL